MFEVRWVECLCAMALSEPRAIRESKRLLGAAYDNAALLANGREDGLLVSKHSDSNRRKQELEGSLDDICLHHQRYCKANSEPLPVELEITDQPFLPVSVWLTAVAAT